MRTLFRTGALFISGVVLAFILTFILLLVLPTHPENEQHKQIMSYVIPGVPANISFLAPNEVQHMQDVRRVVNVVLIVFILCGFFLWRWGVPDTKYAGYGLVALLAFIGGMSLQGFGGFWVRFHQIFFPQGGWQFAANSTLITLYPESYFLNASLIFAGLALIVAAAFIGNFKIPKIQN